jgi:lipopolysaccharide transport system permease protein
MQSNPLSPIEMLRSCFRNRKLIAALTKREIIGKYQGSTLGIVWSVLNPIFTLAVYTFVFSVVFKARWSGGSDSKTEFALILFAGLMIFNLFSECMNKAPTLILSNLTYVKKVVFPLEILPVVTLCAAFFHMLVSFIVWLIFFVIFMHAPPITIILAPVLIIPLMLISLGTGWLISSLSVYFRDIGQVIGILTTILLFMSPVFYPTSVLPPEYQKLLYFNPLTPTIEYLRSALINGVAPDAWSFLEYFLKSLIFACVGFAWFQKTRKGFADVL